MKQKALVTAIEDENIFVVPLIKSECSTCTAGCDKRGSAFAVENIRKLNIKIGDTVNLGTASLWQGIRGLISLFFPILCAILGYFLSPLTARLFGKTNSEGTKALSVLFFLFISAFIVLLLTRKTKSSTKSIILSVD